MAPDVRAPLGDSSPTSPEKGWIEPGAFALQPDGDKPRCKFCQMVLSTADTHTRLCDRLFENGAVQSPALLEAWRAVDRADFCPEGSAAYSDAAVFMGHGAQVSAPHVHARGLQLLIEKMMDACRKDEPMKILEVGSGCGFVSALLATFLQQQRGTGRGDTVLAVEHVPELSSWSIENVKKNNGALLKDEGGVLDIRCGDAFRIEGVGPGSVDFIYSGCAFESATAGAGAELFGLLNEGGRFVSPFGPADEPQRLCAIDKLVGGGMHVREDIIVLFVPAKDLNEQRERGENWYKYAAIRAGHVRFNRTPAQPTLLEH